MKFLIPYIIGAGLGAVISGLMLHSVAFGISCGVSSIVTTATVSKFQTGRFFP